LLTVDAEAAYMKRWRFEMVAAAQGATLKRP
jgi:hypothetical protein